METVLKEYWLPILVTSLLLILVIRLSEKKAFLKEYGLPTLIASLLLLAWGKWFLVAVVGHFLVGLAFKPRHVWIPWMGAVVAAWIYWAVLWLTGNWPWTDPRRMETLGGAALETLIFSVAFTLLPLAFGKAIRWAAEDLREQRRVQSLMHEWMSTDENRRS
jgi:hypothetical protein